ncbi:MAG: hypothetical protein HC913_12625 [Microscillaceae bacterium]|nr:hypothetical protein [Microscillaceae bacterium]
MRSVLRKVYQKLKPKQRSGEEYVNYKDRGVINLIDVGAVGDLPAPWFRHPEKIKKTPQV